MASVTGTKLNLQLAALQGANTFGGEAATRLTQLYPDLFRPDVIYFQTSDEALGFETDRADASCAPQQMTRTGYHPGIQAYIARPESKLHVIAETTHAYHCALLVKPGTKLQEVREVRGHTGSITQSRAWLEKNAPHIAIKIVDTSSMDAAQNVAEGDGSVASVGTPAMAAKFGLEQLAKDIDGGSVGSYWAISPKPIFSNEPTRVLVAGRFHDDGRLTRIISALDEVGYVLETIFSAASGTRLFEYDYVMRFRGSGTLSSASTAIASVEGARLAGAFEIRDGDHEG